MLLYTCHGCGQRVSQYDINDPGHTCNAPTGITSMCLVKIANELKMAQDYEGQPSFNEYAIDQLMRLVRERVRR